MSRAILVGALALVALSFDAGAARVEVSHAGVYNAPPSNAAGRPDLPEPTVSYPTAAADACGYWTATYAEIARRYGELRNCAPADAERSAWVITTLGRDRARGVIAVYRCTSAACRDGRTDHPINGWRIFPPPYAGGVTLLGQPGPTTLLVGNGGHEIVFDVQSGRYSG